MCPGSGLCGHHSRPGCKGDIGVGYRMSPATALYRENKIETFVRLITGSLGIDAKFCDWRSDRKL
jgi:hypothetical protein